MNILWILEDALRPANMGCYGYSRNTTPNCDALARDGVVFDSMIATASHTLPPIVSMIMSQTTATHGVVNCERFAAWKDGGAWSGVRTPLHALADRGFVIDGELVTRWRPLGFTTETPSDGIEAFFERNVDRSWFFYAEPYPTHLPYNPPEEYLERFLPSDYRPDAATRERAKVVQSYLIVHPSGCISKLEAGEKDPLPDEDTDEAHKRTAGTVDLLPQDRPVAKLKQLGIFEDTLIVITADHGEELMERGHVGHSSCNLHGTLYDESIRVPLILHWPKRLPRGRRVSAQVSQIDIMPTLFELLELPRGSDMEGESMLPLIDGRETCFRELAFAETTPAGWQALAGDNREIWCVRSKEWKLILNTDSDDRKQEYELYDLLCDPGERHNVLGERPDVAERLGRELRAYVARARARRR
jgi:arylsulfatase A-like enzyme